MSYNNINFKRQWNETMAPYITVANYADGMVHTYYIACTMLDQRMEHGRLSAGLLPDKNNDDIFG